MCKIYKSRYFIYIRKWENNNGILKKSQNEENHKEESKLKNELYY